MKRLLFALAIVFALAACSMPTGTDKIASASSATTAAFKPVAYVYNSTWENISLSDLASKVASKGISAKGLAKDTTSDYTLDDVKTAVATYNSATTDDQLFVETEETSVAESPNANAYIILATTHKVVDTFLDRPRTEFVTDKRLWDSQLLCDQVNNGGAECLLYVDNTPPAEIVYVPPEPKLWVALLDMTSKTVYYSEHFDTEAEAIHEYQFCIVPQVTSNTMGPGDGNGSPGDVWQAYIGTVEATTENAF